MILFLDFDGVLHPKPVPGRPGQNLFCSLSLLEDVLRQAPGVEVVISSSWREAHPLDEMRQFFSEDIRHRIVGVTPMPGRDSALAPAHLREFSRHAECLAWLARWRPAGVRWLAIDDTPDEFADGCEQLLVVDGTQGLTPSTAAQLLSRLTAVSGEAR